MSDSLHPHGLQQARLLCPPLFLRVCSNSCPLSQWCYLTIPSSVSPFSSCLQTFPASESLPMSWLFPSRGPRYWEFHLSISLSSDNSGLISFRSDWLNLLAFQGTLRSLRKHQFFSAQLSLWSNSHICTWLLETIALTIQTFVSKGMSLLFIEDYLT